jgi:hypothetical protein
MEVDFMPNGPASDYETVVTAFNFVDHFIIWQEDTQQYILNGRPEEMEMALRSLLIERGAVDDTETE